VPIQLVRLATPETGFLSAEVCVHGHLATAALEHDPERGAKFCSQCGAETIRACPKCGVPIRGHYVATGVLRRHEFPPNYCHDCGTAFPWTAAKLAAAKEHAAELAGLDEAEKTRLQGAIDDLAAGGPRIELAASRFKSLMGKAGQAVGSGFYKIVLDVATEAAKRGRRGPKRTNTWPAGCLLSSRLLTKAERETGLSLTRNCPPRF
jgi:hypothetical protein